MKVELISTSISRNAGGVLNAVCGLSKKLDERADIDIRINSVRDNHSNEDIELWKPLNVVLSDSHFPKTFFYSQGLYAKLVDSKADLAHVHGLWTYPTLAVHNWSRRKKRPYIISPHGMLDSWAIKNSHIKKAIIQKLYHKNFLDGAACIHALCDSEADSIRQFGIKNPICIIPNGVEILEKKNDNIYDWKRDNVKVLLYLGRLHPKKGLMNLVKAWESICLKIPNHNWHLAIVGWDQNRYQDKITSYVDRNGLSRSIHFLGPRFNNEKDSCYQHAAAFILPSYSEGLPLSILEAWSYKLPVLMTPECNLSDGFSLDAAIRIETSVESITEGLVQLFHLSDEKLRKIGENGYNLANTKFTWQAIADDMSDVYQWAVGMRDRPKSIHID